jgi:hypothetical protein
MQQFHRYQTETTNNIWIIYSQRFIKQFRVLTVPELRNCRCTHALHQYSRTSSFPTNHRRQGRCDVSESVNHTGVSMKEGDQSECKLVGLFLEVMVSAKTYTRVSMKDTQ